MDFPGRIPPGLVEKLVGLTGLQKAYFGVQNAGRNVAVPAMGPPAFGARRGGVVAARINGDVSKGRHHTVTIAPTREYAPPNPEGFEQILLPSPVIAKIRFAQDGNWTDFFVDVKRGVNITVPAAMIEISLINEGPLPVVSEEGSVTVGRTVDVAVFIDEQPYFKRHNATFTHRFSETIVNGGNVSATREIPSFAIDCCAIYPGQSFTYISGAILEYLDENGNVVAAFDYSSGAIRPTTVPVPNGAVSYRIRNIGVGSIVDPVVIWELCF